MKLSIWKKLDDNLNEFEGLYSGQCSQNEIEEAEKVLNVHFSSEYIKFLQLYGGANVEGDFVYGLKKQRSMGKDFWSVIQNTNFYKHDQQWPDIDDWYIISDDGRGNPIGCKPDGSVWLSDHDAEFEQIKLADNFEEFMHKLLTDTLYE